MDLFPTTRKKTPGKAGMGRLIYSEVVKYLESLGYEIEITEEEYYELENIKKVPATCPEKHGICNVNIHHLKKGKTCCVECGKIKC